MNDIASYHGKNPRNGWYLQQLIKLYASFVIDGLMDTYLVLDSDTFLLRPTAFFNENGIPLYNVGDEYHIPYFKHMEVMHPSLQRQVKPSGICHHMIFQKSKINHLFQMVCSHHNNDFWRVFLQGVDKKQILYSGGSEYEIYFHFLHKYYKKDKDFIIRELKWKNCNVLNMDDDKTYHYISCHAYMRNGA
jgi:hypothetical protein